MSEPKGIYKTNLPGFYLSNPHANKVEIDSQTLDHINALLEAAKADLHEAQAMIDRQAEAIRQRDQAFLDYKKMLTGLLDQNLIIHRYFMLEFRRYDAEMQALMSSTSVTGGDER